MLTTPIANTAAPTGPAAPAAPSGPSKALTSDFETFLKMLTAQMTNQDPLDPIDSADYAVQLATFSSVEQQVQTNDLLKALSSQFGTSSMAQLAGWVGQEARVTGPAHFVGAPITIIPAPSPAAEEVRLVVTDGAGNLVESSPLPRSTDPVQWAGRRPDGSSLPEGSYSFTVESLARGEVIASTPAESYQLVREVQMQGGQLTLILAGGIAAPAASVTAVREPY